MSEQRVVTGSNFGHVLNEVIALSNDGWVLSQEVPPEETFFNAGYVVTMERTEASVAALKARADGIQAAPKLTRAEILAKAREARGKGKIVMTVTAG